MSCEVLERATLVLNRNWQPIHVTTVIRALTMLWNETAKVVESVEYRLYDWHEWSELVPEAGDPYIRTSRNRMRIPEVICLSNYDRFPTKAVTFSRRNIAKRDHYTCQYCGVQPGFDEITVDHVVPRSRGGSSTWLNCVAACTSCNARKADRTPEQAGMHLRRRPVRPDWKPYDTIHGVRIPSWSHFVNDEAKIAFA